jgi:hypothetical protein
LVNLESDFFNQSKNYLKHLKSQTLSEDPLIAALFNKRLERAMFLVEDLVNLRMQKHFLKSTPTGQSSLTKQDEKFKTKLEDLVRDFKSVIFEIETEEEEEEITKKYTLVRVKDDVENMGIDEDLFDYGPFYKDDIVYLPSLKYRKLKAESSVDKISLD